MTEAEILWKNILLRANGKDSLPRKDIEDMLSTYSKDAWEVLFDKAVVGYEKGELIIDVSRETLEAALTEITDF